MEKTTKKLNILLVTSDKFPPTRPAARVIYGEELPKRNHRVDWVIQAEKSCEESYVQSVGEGNIYVIATDDGESRWNRLRKHWLSISGDFRMIGLAIKNKYDLVQVKDKYISAILAIVLCKILRIKFYYWIAFPHGEASIYEVKNGIARYPIFYLLRGYFMKFILYRIICNAAEHIFVQSEQMKQDFINEGVPDRKMTPVPGSVNLDDIPYDIESNHNIETNEISIVYLGTFNRMRHLDFVIRMFSKVLEQIPHAKLYMLGKGDSLEDEEFLRKIVMECGIEKSVIFTGYLPMKQAWGYIKQATVCISPYFPTPILLSTSPTKLIEYMAMGKPVVGNEHPEQKLVIDESGAGICTPWEEQAFANAVVTIASDPEQAKQMSNKGRAYVEKFRTNGFMADIVEKEYLKLFQFSNPQ